MAEEDALLVDNVEGGLCVDYTDAGIVGRCNSGSNKDKGDYICRDGHILICNFNNYKMVDSRPVMEQYNELLRILGQYTQHGLKMDESISVSSIIDKLPPSWKDFKLYFLKHGPGHFKGIRRSWVNKKKANAGGSGKGSKDHSQDQGQNLVDAIAWWIDSGATTHVCKDRCWFKTYEPVEDGSVLYMGDDHFAPVHGKGSVVLEFSLGKSITLFNVLYVPKLRFGYYNNGMFMLNLNKVPDDSDSVYMSSSTVNFIPAIDENPDKCTTCMLTKITRQPFKSITRKSVILELIHSDLCDFHATPSLGNKKYVITFIDDASRFCYVYLLHAKDEALDKFRIYKTEVELQQNDLIKSLRTDRGGEYYDPIFFQSVGIIHETTAPYTPQQNGVAERKNRALKEMVNSMLSYSGLSEGFWGEAMLTACYLLNRVPNKRNKTTPYELWYKKRPNLAFLRVWGCRAVVRLPDPKRKTLGEKGIDCIFVGYAEHSKAYRFYVIEPNDSVSINSIIESRDAIFDENRFSSIPRPKDIIPKLDESQRDDILDGFEGSRDQVGSQYSYCYSIEEDPRTYNEAMQS
ncbi:zinc finger, CCHC-type containing protein [Tanacetum coccineum]